MEGFCTTEAVFVPIDVAAVQNEASSVLIETVSVPTEAADVPRY